MPSGNTVSLDVSGMTQLAASFSVSNATMNGNPASALSSVSVGADGTVSFVYASGTKVAAYKVPLGNVESPEKLTSLSGDVFQQSLGSGDITIGEADANGLGTINSSELESSTVDLASQLTDMIQAQRGYEANSKVFQAGSDLMSELFNMLK
jgi:flagellar hook protein FlgE